MYYSHQDPARGATWNRDNELRINNISSPQNDNYTFKRVSEKKRITKEPCRLGCTRRVKSMTIHPSDGGEVKSIPGTLSWIQCKRSGWTRLRFLRKRLPCSLALIMCLAKHAAAFLSHSQVKSAHRSPVRTAEKVSSSTVPIKQSISRSETSINNTVNLWFPRAVSS